MDPKLKSVHGSPNITQYKGSIRFPFSYNTDPSLSQQEKYIYELHLFLLAWLFLSKPADHCRVLSVSSERILRLLEQREREKIQSWFLVLWFKVLVYPLREL